MQNLEKIRQPVFDFPVTRRKFLSELKTFAFRIFPRVFAFFSVSLILLFVQVFLVGIADRLGFSPKWSVLVTSLFFAFGFGGLAILGGFFKEKITIEDSPFLDISAPDEPFCKILMIRRKDKQGN